MASSGSVNPAKVRAARVASTSLRSLAAAWLARPLASLHLLLGVFALLTALGLVMVLSASSVQSLTQDGSSYGVFVRQAGFCAGGLVLFWVGLRIPPRRLRALAAVLLVIVVVLLVGVLIPQFGTALGGARKWYLVAGLSFQPSEPAKVVLALWGAHVLAMRRAVLHRWRRALLPVIPVALVMLTLVVLEPDLGTAISIAVVVIALLFFAGASGRLLAAVTAGALAGVVLLGLMAEYRQSRITSFLSTGDADPLGAAYQSKQALYSLADGGLFGVGLGQGRAKWSYLPNAHNDFIFAIIGEELGLLGALAVLAVFATLAYTGLRIAARNTDPWMKIVAATLTTWLVGQAAINIGYVVGLLPVTGIPLPMISSGGTSLVVTMFVFGVLANCARHEPEAVVALRAREQSRLTRLLGLGQPEPSYPRRRNAAPTRSGASPRSRR
jgi:cell division protein FtsW